MYIPVSLSPFQLELTSNFGRTTRTRCVFWSLQYRFGRGRTRQIKWKTIGWDNSFRERGNWPANNKRDLIHQKARSCVARLSFPPIGRIPALASQAVKPLQRKKGRLSYLRERVQPQRRRGSPAPLLLFRSRALRTGARRFRNAARLSRTVEGHQG